MKVIQEQLLIPNEESFILRRLDVNKFYSVRHFHRPLEIKYIIEGYGKAIIGDHIYDYKPGDLILIGPNLPHHWVSDTERRSVSKAIFIQFNEDFYGNGIYEKRDFISIRNLLLDSRGGIRFIGPDNAKVYRLMQSLEYVSKGMKIIKFIEMLHIMAETEGKKILSPYKAIEYDNKDDDRLNDVYQYIINNYKYDCNLEHASEISNLSKASFCRYFKKRTQKTFSEFVNQVRLWDAGNQLISSDRNISEIAYSCGFNNISLFNRLFQKQFGIGPREYRKNSHL